MSKRREPGCPPPGGPVRRGRVEKKVHFTKVLYALFTCINLLLSLFYAVYTREEVVRAVQQEDRIHLLAAKKSQAPPLVPVPGTAAKTEGNQGKEKGPIVKESSEKTEIQ